MYIILIFGILILAEVVSAVRRLSTDIIKLTVFERIMYVSETIITCSIYISILTTNFVKLKSWNTLFKELSKFDTQCRNVTHTKNYCAILRLIMLFVGCPCSSIFDLVIWERSGAYQGTMLSFLPQHIVVFYEDTIILFLYEMTCAFQLRYNYLQENLGYLILHSSSSALKKGVHKLKMLYKILYFASDGLNKIFGFLILVILTHLQMLFLVQFYWVLFVAPTSSISLLAEGMIFIPAIYLVSM